MKKNFFFELLFLLCTISFTSCKEERKYLSVNIIPVSSEVGNYSLLNLSDFVSDIDYIPLETSDDALIANIHDIVYENEKIIIWDYLKPSFPEKCLLFDKNGGWITNLGNKGQGPNEYIFIQQIFADNDGIYMKVSPHFLMQYDFSGNLIGKISVPKGEKEKGQYMNFTIIQPLKENIFVFDITSVKEKYPIAMLFAANDTGSTIIKEYPVEVNFNIDSRMLIRSSFENAIMYRYKDNVRLYKRIHSDTIFTIGKDLEMSDGFVFDLGKYKLPVSLYKEPMYIRTEWKNFIWIINIKESLNYLFITFDFGSYCPEPYGSTVVYGVFDKNKSKLMLMKRPKEGLLGFRNDIDDGPVIWPRYISSKNELITFISAEDFLEHVEQMKDLSPKLSALAKRIVTDDNPIVIVAKLKE